MLDGGSLLQRLPWPKRAYFDVICDIYIDHVKTKYPKSIVVFDGYDCGPSTKDNTHLRRSKGKIAAEVHFKGSMLFQSKKEEFLANATNKQNFIHMLSNKFQHGCETLQAAGDADLLIVQTVLLCMHAEMDNEDIIFQSETKQKSTKFSIWDIKKTKKVIGLEKCYLLSVVHAISGCDTTSRVFGIGKSSAPKKLKSKHFVEQPNTFSNKEATAKEIKAAGENLLVVLYNGRERERLDTLRYQRFCEKVSSSSQVVEVQALKPTSSAAEAHSKRVFLQVQDWMGRADQMVPEA